MATKIEIYKAVLAASMALCDTHKISKSFTEKLQEILDENLKPKAGGAVVNIDDVTKKDKDGNIVEIQCSVSGVFLPATAEFFYEDKAGKGINGLKRLSRQAEGVRKSYIKALAATEKAIMADVLDGKMTPEAGKAKLEKARAVKPDYSTVTAKLPAKEDKEKLPAKEDKEKLPAKEDKA